jgi:cytochrome bd-type quinol oxidase subunit 2
MRNRRAYEIHLVAIGITALISAAYLLVDTYEGSGPSQTVVQANGTWVIALLLVPLVLVALPLLVPPDRRRTAFLSAATALTLFALITGFTIGTPYLLAAAVMWVAGGIQRAPARPSSATRC